MRKAALALGVPAAAATAVLAASYGFYRYIFHSPAKGQNDDHAIPFPPTDTVSRARTHALIDALAARPSERVSITSFDGLRLYARLYHTRPGAPLAILCHGYRGTALRDFCGGANAFLSMGWNVLLIEQRAHCTSEGHTISFGINERWDCLAWCHYASARFGSGTSMILVGISMGAATVLMASELTLPENIRGIIADCPYTSPEAIIRKVGAKRGFPIRLAMPLARLGARLFGGFSLSTPANAASAVRRARVPILLIHGEADGFVPCDMSREIASAAPERVELHTFPGARHGTSYLVDTERYVRLVRTFCDRALGGSA